MIAWHGLSKQFWRIGSRRLQSRLSHGSSGHGDPGSLRPAQFFDLLKDRGLQFYAGVPDSLLKDFCAYVQDHSSQDQHIICANEGAAIGVAAGYHLGTGRIPIVYLQNSGLGNAVNPLVSLCDSNVYSLPMLLLIGWRGEPGVRDEVQHQVQGRITPPLLDDLSIPFQVLPNHLQGAKAALDTALQTIQERNIPYAFLVRKQCFEKYKLQHNEEHDDCLLTRERVLEIILPELDHRDAVIATTGFTSRELHEYRLRSEQNQNQDFLMFGSMGHATSISLGVALTRRSHRIWCLDGDGASLMHLGSMATIAIKSSPNLKHVLFNNASHESVGGQPSGGFNIDFSSVANALGYKLAMSATSAKAIRDGIRRLRDTDGPAFLEIRICKGVRKDLSRPKLSPIEIKKAFMEFLSDDDLKKRKPS